MRFIKDHSHEFGIEKMYAIFKVSRSDYYAWLRRKPSKTQLESEQIKADVQRVYMDSKSRYGSPKVTEELRTLGWKVSLPRIVKMILNEGIGSILCEKFRGATTGSRHNLLLAETI